MATSYPGGLDAFPNPTSSTDVDDASADLKHHAQHGNANDAIEAVQAELGTNPSGSSATVAARLAAQRRTVVNPAALSMVTVPGVVIISQTSSALSANQDYYYPLWCEDAVTFDRLQLEVTTVGTAGTTIRTAIYNADASWQPTGTLIEDFGTVAGDSLGVKTSTPAGGSRTLPPGRYVLVLNASAAVGVRAARGALASSMLWATMSSNMLAQYLRVGRAHAAFPSTGVAWTSANWTTNPQEFNVFLRVTGVG